MTVLRYRILLLVGIVILTGCASLRTDKDQPVEQPTKSVGEQSLVNGIGSYEDGDYKSAAKHLQDALNAGLTRIDSSIAHKYLAFITCSSNNKQRCREEFRMAFEDNPHFVLDAAEMGHPLWGPVYRSVREQMKSKEKAR